MLIWHRWGILVVVIGGLPFYLTPRAVDALYGEGYYNAEHWPRILELVIASISIWIVGRLLNKDCKALNQKHRFFWLPMEYWGLIMLVLGILKTLR